MSLRVCLVSPFAWSQPHDVNEHVAGVAAALRRLGHHVTVLAPSTRASDLLAARRALLNGADAEVIALGPALPVSRRSRVGVPVGVRANLSLALVAGDYTIVSPGVDLDLFRPGEKRRLAVLEWRPTERPLARAVIRALREVPDWELILLRTKPLAGRPYRPASLRERIHVRTARDGRARAPIFAEASIVVPALTGLPRVPLEAAAAGAAVAAPPAMREQPELAAPELARLAEDDEYRARTAAKHGAEAQTQG